MNFKTTITKEEVNEMPLSIFEGEIVVVNDTKSLKKAISDLKKHTILGFDTETKPSFARGISHKVALVQISTDKTCYLFRLNNIGFPPELEKLLADKSIKKIGLSLRDDIMALHKRSPRVTADSFIDLQKIITDYGIDELSLQKIYALIFGKKISKAQRLSNWELPELSESQMRYAATDAWACLEIYIHVLPLKKIKKEIKKIELDDIPVFE
jgi:ribonuclease D